MAVAAVCRRPVSTDQANTSSPASGRDDRSDGDGAQCAVWCVRPDEDRPHLCLAGAPMPQVLDYGPADVVWQRQPVDPVALASDGDLTAAPVDIVDAQRRHLPGPQPEADQQRQNREVPAAGRSAPVTRRQQLRHLITAQRFGDSGKRPAGHRRHPVGERPVNYPIDVNKPQQRAESSYKPSHRPRSLMGLGHHERGYLTRVQPLQVQPLSSKAAPRSRVVSDGAWVSASSETASTCRRTGVRPVWRHTVRPGRWM